MSNLPIAKDSNKSALAKKRLETQVLIGERRQAAIVEQVSSMVIKDALILPREMSFSHEGGLKVTAKGHEFTVHSHALGQVAGVLEYPKSYLSKLQNGVVGISPGVCRKKMCDDLNWHAHNAKLTNRKKQDAKYLMRYVGTEIRGFLSQSFKRHLASAPLMRAFLHSCMSNGLVPIDGHASPVRVNLQCVLPYVFEPYDGEFVSVGVSWSNSDFGGGRMKVSMFMKRVNGDSAVILDDAISEVHIGPVIEETDIEMSAETVEAELKAQRSAIDDAVSGQVSADNIQKLLDVIQMAHEEEIPWYRLRNELGSILQRKELEHMRELLNGTAETGLEELPPIHYDAEGDPVATRWWSSAVLGQIADKEDNVERKKELQELAGQILGKTKKAA
jgi:hypothetical protein